MILPLPNRSEFALQTVDTSWHNPYLLSLRTCDSNTTLMFKISWYFVNDRLESIVLLIIQCWYVQTEHRQQNTCQRIQPIVCIEICSILLRARNMWCLRKRCHLPPPYCFVNTENKANHRFPTFHRPHNPLSYVLCFRRPMMVGIFNCHVSLMVSISMVAEKYLP